MHTQIVLIGTLHKRHETNQLYPAAQVGRILEGIDARVILMDLPVGLAGDDGWLPENVLQRNLRPEFLPVLEASRKLHAGVAPIDMPDYTERIDEINRGQNEANDLLQAWREHMEEHCADSPFLKVLALAYEMGGIQRHFLQHSGAYILNDEGFDRLVRMRHNVWNDLFPDILQDFPAYSGLADFWRAYHTFWYNRNRAMMENILKVAEAYAGKRLAVVVGVEHRYILRDLLPRRDALRICEFWELDT